MTVQDDEPAEAYLAQLVPDLQRQWEGADAAEIDRILGFVGRPLPDFYRLFLSRMGRSMGPLGFPTLDFSVRTIVNLEDRRWETNDRH